jgi:hypothetical protein
MLTQGPPPSGALLRTRDEPEPQTMKLYAGGKAATSFARLLRTRSIEEPTHVIDFTKSANDAKNVKFPPATTVLFIPLDGPQAHGALPKLLIEGAGVRMAAHNRFLSVVFSACAGGSCQVGAQTKP